MQSCSPLASYGDPLDSVLVVSVNTDDKKQQEEESRRRIEFEEEERQLEETLEYQRQIEKEAKQKQLAEQSKKQTVTHPDKFAEKLQMVNFEPCANDQDMQVPLKPHVHDHLVQKKGSSNNLESGPINMANGSPASLKASTVSGTQMINGAEDKIHPGIPNGGILEDGFLPSDRRPGRKNRRQRSSSKVPDVKSQALLSEKETIEVGRSNGEGHLITVRSSDYLPADSNNSKELRRQHAEEDDEERFQADLKKAVRQSLDMRREPVAPTSLRIALSNLYPESDELLNLVEMNHLLACDPEAGGCGKLNYIHHILSTPPHVLTTWEKSPFFY